MNESKVLFSCQRVMRITKGHTHIDTQSVSLYYTSSYEGVTSMSPLVISRVELFANILALFNPISSGINVPGTVRVRTSCHRYRTDTPPGEPWGPAVLSLCSRGAPQEAGDPAGNRRVVIVAELCSET